MPVLPAGCPLWHLVAGRSLEAGGTVALSVTLACVCGRSFTIGCAMPALIIDCPSCGRKLRVPDEMLGTAVRCPTCEHTFQATAEQGPTPPTGDHPTETFSPGEQPSPRGEEASSRCPMCGERIEKGVPS